MSIKFTKLLFFFKTSLLRENKIIPGAIIPKCEFSLKRECLNEKLDILFSKLSLKKLGKPPQKN